jgi:inorganic pyrophosphatase
MPKPLLSCLPALDRKENGVTAVIETPKGSANKYNYDDECGAFRLGGVLPEGSTFPYDFGLIPSTLGDDGDPLDVLVFMDNPVPIGCILTVRLIGVIEAKQREHGGDWVQNDRLLAVATKAHTHRHVVSINDLRPGLLDEIEAFFCNYNEQKGKKFKPVDRSGPKKAHKLLEQGIAAFSERAERTAESLD